MRIFLWTLFMLLQCTFTYAAAFGMHPDSVSVRDTRVTVAAVAVPAVLIATGASGLVEGPVKDLNLRFRSGLWDLRGDSRFRADDYLQYAPLAANLGLDFIGVKARHDFMDRALVTATASLSVAAIVTTVKYTVCARRPDLSAYNSFPSGHTATAFVGAELVRIEYGNAYGAAAYAAALGVGFLRMYNDRHWFNDVLAGAGVGILSAHVGYWLLPLEKRLAGRIGKGLCGRKGRVQDAGDIAFAAMPSYDMGSRSAVLSVSLIF